jgi:hypothetical protein
VADVRWLIFLVLVGCGGGSHPANTDGPVLVDARCDGDTCNPMAQTGCNLGEKCTWIHDKMPRCNATGHIGCVPVTGAEAALGQSCAFGQPGATGFDNCVAGAICEAATCRTICDPQQAGQATGCDPTQTCTGHADLFDVAGTIIFGTCD